MSDKKQRSGGQIICDAMLSEGTGAIFGMPGGASLPFYDALYQNPQIKHYSMRHEQGAGYAADGYARAMNRVGVCTATSGPGATNLVTSMASAMMDSVPVVFITGQVATDSIGSDAFQETDITGVSIPVTKQNYLVKDVNELPQIVAEAFYLARSGRPGPVHIDVPKDVLLATTDIETPTDVKIPGYRPAGTGHKGMIRRAAEAINKSEKPVILAGHGIAISEAFEELRELAEKAKIPVITTLHGVGNFPETHELSFGMLGMHGMYYANLAVHNCDLIIALGMRFDDRVTGRIKDFAPNASIVHIDIDPAEIEKVVPTAVPIVGDVKATLEVLNPLVEAAEHGPWLEQLRALKSDHPSHEIRESKILLPQRVIRSIYDATNGDAKVIADVGQNQMWASQHFFYDKPLSFFSAGGLGGMGYSLPAAIGVQIAKPDDTVWSVTGDGGLQINIQELAMLAEYNLPVKIAVINNGHLGMIRQWQNRFYDGHLMGAKMHNPDFAVVAEAFGVRGISADSEESANKAIADAMNHDGPVLIDFVVSPDEDVFPMVEPGASLAETVEG
jgi:acetolactate synthase-1/2/3 large subunit